MDRGMGWLTVKLISGVWKTWEVDWRAHIRFPWSPPRTLSVTRKSSATLSRSSSKTVIKTTSLSLLTTSSLRLMSLWKLSNPYPNDYNNNNNNNNNNDFANLLSRFRRLSIAAPSHTNTHPILIMIALCLSLALSISLIILEKKVWPFIYSFSLRCMYNEALMEKKGRLIWMCLVHRSSRSFSLLRGREGEKYDRSCVSFLLKVADIYKYIYNGTPVQISP